MQAPGPVAGDPPGMRLTILDTGRGYFELTFPYH